MIERVKLGTLKSDDIDPYDYCYGCGRKMSLAKKYSELAKAIDKGIKDAFWKGI